jgi:hypothetical protein
MKEPEVQNFSTSTTKFGPIVLTYLIMVLTCGLPAHGQQLSAGNATREFAQYSQAALAVGDVKPAPCATPTPMPDMPGMESRDEFAKKTAPSATPTPTPDAMIKSPTAMPNMPGMKSSDDPAKKTEMDDGMGATGLVPPGVMVGMAGRWMVGYQVMFDRLEGNLVGSRRVSEATVLNQFETSPTDMTMQMHMFTVMYTPSGRFTIMAMLPYIKMSMGELHRDGTRSTERSQGIGDLELSGHYLLSATKYLRHRFLLNAGIGLPTGSINQRDAGGARLE